MLSESDIFSIVGLGPAQPRCDGPASRQVFGPHLEIDRHRGDPRACLRDELDRHASPPVEGSERGEHLRSDQRWSEQLMITKEREPIRREADLETGTRVDDQSHGQWPSRDR